MPVKGPFDAGEASELRLKGESVPGCWFCLNRGYPKPYWLESETTIREGEHMIRCPKHSGDSA